MPEQLRSAQVSADYFRLFGAPVFRGRTFTPEEDLSARATGLWRLATDFGRGALPAIRKSSERRFRSEAIRMR